MKPLFNDINKYTTMYFHNHNILNSFKFKHIDGHKNNNKILIPCNNIHYNLFNFNSQYYINLISVSIYYSNRYNNFNHYIETNYSNELNNSLKYFNKENINYFITNYITKFLIKR